MPISIYIDDRDQFLSDENSTKIAFLCDDDWELPTQVWELEKWIYANHNKIPRKKIVADIGFTVRKDASGGGAVLNAEVMRLLSNANIDVYFSEYSPSWTEEKT